MDKDYKALWDALYLWLNDYAWTYAPDEITPNDARHDRTVIYQTAQDIMNEMEKLEHGKDNV